jgi:hypothetical protein
MQSQRRFLMLVILSLKAQNTWNFIIRKDSLLFDQNDNGKPFKFISYNIPSLLLLEDYNSNITGILDYITCSNVSDTCYSPDFVCCVAPADNESQKVFAILIQDNLQAHY